MPYKDGEKAKENNREASLRSYYRKTSGGKCATCGGERERDDRTRCSKCREQASLASKKFAQARLEKGLCVRCAEPSDRPGKRFCSSCTTKSREYSKSRAKPDLKRAVMEAYGGAECACCGEAEMAFLTLDHINGDGKEDRKKLGLGVAFYANLKKGGFPRKDELQVLCFNCNCGRSVNGGVCPHAT